MKKISVILLLMLALSGCSQEFQGEHRVECVSGRNSELNGFGVKDYPINYTETMTIEATDNLINHSFTKLEFRMEEDVLKYLQEELNNDQEALLREYIDFYMADSQDFYDNLADHKIIYLMDRIVVEMHTHYDAIEKSWKTIIIPEDRNFSQVVARLKKIGLVCEVYKK